MSSRGAFEAALDESSCRLVAALFLKKRRKKRLPVVGSRWRAVLIITISIA